MTEQQIQDVNPVIDLDFLKDRPLSFSSLKEFKKSPRHYMHYVTTKKPPMTDAMKLGHLAEWFLLNDELGDRFYVMPKCDRRTKAGKAEFEQHYQKAIGKMMVDQGQVDKAKDMAKQALQDPLIFELVHNKTRVQKKLEWKELVTYEGKEYRIPMIGYVDMESVTAEGQFIIDIKTDRNGNPDDFTRTITRMNYHLQGGAYAIGYMKTAFRFPGFRWIVMDSSEPHGAFVMELSPKDMEIAKAEIKGLIQKFVQCMVQDRWDEDYRFWLREESRAFSFFLPKWATSAVQYFEDDETGEGE